MALVKLLEEKPLQTLSRHTEVACSYTVVNGEDGRKYLQLDTYGSAGRAIPGKKSQSLRLSPEAIAQIKHIIEQHEM